MSSTEKNVFLVLTSALVLRGEVVKAGALVEVSNRDAMDFLRRGKARLATEKDGAPVEAAEAQPDSQAEAEAAEQAATERAMKDNELDAAAWAALSDRKRAALVKAAAEAIAKDAAA